MSISSWSRGRIVTVTQPRKVTQPSWQFLQPTSQLRSLLLPNCFSLVVRVDRKVLQNSSPIALCRILSRIHSCTVLNESRIDRLKVEQEPIKFQWNLRAARNCSLAPIAGSVCCLSPAACRSILQSLCRRAFSHTIIRTATYHRATTTRCKGPIRSLCLQLSRFLNELHEKSTSH